MSASSRSLTGTTEIRISRGELIQALGKQYEFLWHFGKKLCRCKRCGEQRTAPGPYRIYVNGYGDFALYHSCGSCAYPLHSYVELSQEIKIRATVRKLWLSKFN